MGKHLTLRLLYNSLGVDRFGFTLCFELFLNLLLISFTGLSTYPGFRYLSLKVPGIKVLLFDGIEVFIIIHFLTFTFLQISDEPYQSTPYTFYIFFPLFSFLQLSSFRYFSFLKNNNEKVINKTINLYDVCIISI